MSHPQIAANPAETTNRTMRALRSLGPDGRVIHTTTESLARIAGLPVGTVRSELLVMRRTGLIRYDADGSGALSVRLG